MNDEIHCPNCNSTQITAQKHGFSAGKAVAGAVVTGGLGLLAGLHGSRDIDVTCLSCGHKWNPKKLAEQRKQEELQKQAADMTKWKKSWYEAYEAQNFEEAKRIYLVKGIFTDTAPDIHTKYKLHKKSDLQSNIILGVFLVIIVIIIYWILG
jgi:hypothetical protein